MPSFYSSIEGTHTSLSRMFLFQSTLEYKSDILEMEEKTIVAGFGGQGIMLMGRLLAYAGMIEGRYVTCLPSYGPEMRGGTANCTVIVSTERIGSPYVTQPSSLVAMNRPSLDRFENAVSPDGVILLNTSMVNREVGRKNVKVVKVAASKIAEDLGNIRVANMVALGAYVGVKPIVSIKSLLVALEKILPTRHKDLLAVNTAALQRGLQAFA